MSTYNPANASRWPNAGLMLANVAYGAQHQSSIGPMFGACRVRPQRMLTYLPVFRL